MRKNVEKKDEESFFDKVYKVVLMIPPGRVTSYGAIAEYLGTKGSARMVGWAMNSSHTQTFRHSGSQSSEQGWIVDRQASFWRPESYAATFRE